MTLIESCLELWITIVAVIVLIVAVAGVYALKEVISIFDMVTELLKL